MLFEEIADPPAEVDALVKQAREAGLPLPEAMTLATVDAQGRPRARVVLVKQRLARQFFFFTNYQSDKGRDLSAHPLAELCLHYPSLQLQARISGSVQRVPAAHSDAYFASRPRESQIGAWASEQSRPLPDRATLEKAFEQRQAEFAGGSVPRPQHWGGYALLSEQVELWRGRPGRLHDRARFDFENGSWKLQRLYP